jgi:hypothetical protein
MDEQTLEALKGSIKKWEDIVNGTAVDDGPRNCPLCALFHNLYCYGCPVSEVSGDSCCNNTPYEDWCDHHHALMKVTPLYVKTPEEKSLAQAEVDFLRSLLPPK